ncbi:MAG TPA: EAL domain-containing protein [Acidiferrobacterales bacterium]
MELSTEGAEPASSTSGGDAAAADAQDLAALLRAATLDAVPVCIYWKDAQGVYRGCNRAFAADAALSGPDAVAGRTDLDLPWSASAQQIREHDAAILAGGVPVLGYEVAFPSEAGERCLLASKIPVCGARGEALGLIGCYQDISDYKRNERALRESEHRFRALAEATLEMVVIHENGVILEVNRAGAEGLGARPEELIGRNIMDLTHPDWRERVLERVRAGYEGPYEAVGVRLDGTPFPVELVARNATYRERAVRVVLLRDLSARHNAEQALKTALADVEAAHAQIAAIVENAPAVAMQGYDIEGRVVFWNRASEEFFGYAADAVMGRRLGGLILSEADAASFEALIADVLTSGRPAPLREWQTQTAGGRRRWILSSVFPILRGRERAQVICMDVDITERRESESRALKLSSVVEHTADAVIITDHRGVIEYVNPAFEDITGYRRDETVGRTPALIKSGRHDPEFFRDLWDTIRAGNVYRNVLINRRKDGSVYYEEKTITPLRGEDGSITHFVSTAKDITERMQTQERLQYLAYHDVLTELPNRMLLMDRLEHALARVRWTGRQLAVLFLDLDRFKVINDTLGHDFGDRLLQVMAARLRGCVREGDTVARVSGDEFAILLEDLASTEDVVLVARKILETFAQPFEVFQRELFITTSVGIGVHPADGEDASLLLKHADTAMYRAKEHGRNNYQFYSADMGAKAVELLALETGLRRALERQELILHFQPCYDLRSGRVVSAEALLRWRHRELGLIYPADFIPLLEDTGLIVPIGEWVLEASCAAASRWQRPGRAPVRVSVNLSAGQFNSPQLVDKVAGALETSGLPSELLDLEITESMLMKHAQQTIDTLTALGAMGVRFAIDDFGTGYSSLSYLKRFPIHVLKIDRSFVRDVPGDPDGTAIIQTIVAMAHNLKLQVVAEGVETEQQAGFLRASGCDAVQGHHYSRALPDDEFARLLDASA